MARGEATAVIMSRGNLSVMFALSLDAQSLIVSMICVIASDFAQCQRHAHQY